MRGGSRGRAVRWVQYTLLLLGLSLLLSLLLSLSSSLLLLSPEKNSNT